MSQAVAGMGIPAAGTTPAADRRIIAAATLGSLLEWYDFYIFTLLAGTLANRLLPADAALSAPLLALAYGLGFLARPAGALLLGRWADRQGRKPSFTLSLVLGGSASLLLGLVPDYASIGWAAPLLLLVLRLGQGFSLGGGHGSAITYLAEWAASGQRGQATGWLQSAASLGLLLALLALGLLRLLLGEEGFAVWGWRLPLLLGGVALPIWVYIRRYLPESPVFLRLQAEGRASDAPLRDGLLRYPANRQFLLVLLGAAAGPAALWYAAHLHTLHFLTLEKGVALPNALLLLAAALAIMAPACIFFGWLSDRFGRLRVVMFGCLLALLSYFPLFALLGEAVAEPQRIDYPLALLALVAVLFCASMAFGPLAALLAEMFPAPTRAISVSLAFQLGHGWFGSLLPVAAAAMAASSDSSLVGLWYPVAIAAMSLVVGSLFLRDKMGRNLHA